jgi:hypothetical protein
MPNFSLRLPLVRIQVSENPTDNVSGSLPVFPDPLLNVQPLGGSRRQILPAELNGSHINRNDRRYYYQDRFDIFKYKLSAAGHIMNGQLPLKIDRFCIGTHEKRYYDNDTFDIFSATLNAAGHIKNAELARNLRPLPPVNSRIPGIRPSSISASFGSFPANVRSFSDSSSVSPSSNPALPQMIADRLVSPGQRHLYTQIPFTSQSALNTTGHLQTTGRLPPQIHDEAVGPNEKNYYFHVPFSNDRSELNTTGHLVNSGQLPERIHDEGVANNEKKYYSHIPFSNNISELNTEGRLRNARLANASDPGSFNGFGQGGSFEEEVVEGRQPNANIPEMSVPRVVRSDSSTSHKSLEKSSDKSQPGPNTDDNDPPPEYTP